MLVFCGVLRLGGDLLEMWDGLVCVVGLGVGSWDLAVKMRYCLSEYWLLAEFFYRICHCFHEHRIKRHLLPLDPNQIRFLRESVHPHIFN